MKRRTFVCGPRCSASAVSPALICAIDRPAFPRSSCSTPARSRSAELRAKLITGGRSPPSGLDRRQGLHALSMSVAEHETTICPSLPSDAGAAGRTPPCWRSGPVCVARGARPHRRSIRSSRSTSKPIRSRPALPKASRIPAAMSPGCSSTFPSSAASFSNFSTRRKTGTRSRIAALWDPDQRHRCRWRPRKRRLSARNMQPADRWKSTTSPNSPEAFAAADGAAGARAADPVFAAVQLDQRHQAGGGTGRFSPSRRHHLFP